MSFATFINDYLLLIIAAGAIVWFYPDIIKLSKIWKKRYDDAKNLKQ